MTVNKNIDWNEIWNERYDERKNMERKESGIECWDETAKNYSTSQTTNDFEYGRKVVEALYELITPESEILDIGAGPGTLLIPFANTPYGDFDILWRDVMGEELKRPFGADQNVLYNILYEKGRHANIKMVSYSSLIPVENWITSRERIFDRNIEVTPDVKKLIREHISDRAEDEMYTIEGLAAVMWWKTHNGR